MRKSVLFSVFLFVVALLFGNFALANELFVGTKDGFASVTEAVKAAKAGDTIFIATGVYQEPVETYPIEINLPVSLIGDSGVVLKGPPYKPLLPRYLSRCVHRECGFSSVTLGHREYG